MQILLKYFWGFIYYLKVIAPGMVAGLLASGLIHEFAPDFWMNASLVRGRIKSLFFVSLSGALLPLCSWAELPLAVSFYKRGVGLGPVLSFLLTAPATSIVSLILAYRILGSKFACYIFCAVIFMGVLIGVAGNMLSWRKAKIGREQIAEIEKTQSNLREFFKQRTHKNTFWVRLLLALRYGFVDLLKEIGPFILAGIFLATLFQNSAPLRELMRHSLANWRGYFFVFLLSLTLGNTSYAAVFLAGAFLRQGLSSGATMFFLLLSPVVNYGTILVLKKEFGFRVLSVYLGMVYALAFIFGLFFTFF